jgi:hypothetical protein
LSAAPLHVSGASPGVYGYGSTPTFPSNWWGIRNYSVDVVFSTSATTTPPPPTYSISGRITGSTATVTLSGSTSRSTTTDGLGNYSFSGLTNGSYVVSPSQSGYTFTPPTASVSINSASQTSVTFLAVVVQIPVSHSVTLTWAPSTSPSISGYNVYRGTVSGGPYTKMTILPLLTTSYLDISVAAGQTYFYVATTVQNLVESSYSAETRATIPAP